MPVASGWNFYRNNLRNIFARERRFEGWGRKRTGRFASWCHGRFGGSLRLYEDGFIRSVGLGVDGAEPYGVVEDDLGIYYDATAPSRLERLLCEYDFDADAALMQTAREAMALMRRHRISKYNGAPDVAAGRFAAGDKRVLVVAQTAGDASLRYGMGDAFTTEAMIDAAIAENPDAQVYVKLHPDVISGKKRSDIDVASLQGRCEIIGEDVNPVSLLEHFDAVYTKTSQMGFEALLLGKRCVCFGMPFYAGWGVTDDRVACSGRTRRLGVETIFAAAYILYSRYRDPETGREMGIVETIRAIAARREQGDAFFFGFSRWKHAFIAPFFPEIATGRIRFVNPAGGAGPLEAALKRGLGTHSRIYIWGKKPFDDVEAYAAEHGNALSRVEDGFVRSVGLGSDLTRPYSLVVDSRGIYFDPTQESDLEHLLEHHDFGADPALCERAARVRRHIVEKKLSKYNPYGERELELPRERQIVLVPGQVEDDASIRCGAAGMTNLELLRQARRNAPEAYIVYKPHPDVLAGNRKGHVEEAEALRYCDRVVSDVSLDSVLAHADAVHTMTSLVGFEALLRGKAVTTYGLPFYAGWGLTTDMRSAPRRHRRLELDQLVAGTLLLYPRYVHPQSGAPCGIEALLEALEAERERYRSAWGYRLLQNGRNAISRRLQALWRFAAGRS